MAVAACACVRACVGARARRRRLWVGWLFCKREGLCALSVFGLCPPTPPFPGLGLSFGKMSDTAVADTRRLNSKPQDLTDAYGPPSNFLEAAVFSPQTVGLGRARLTACEVRMRTN